MFYWGSSTRLWQDCNGCRVTWAEARDRSGPGAMLVE
jgi:hypothetical protein